MRLLSHSSFFTKTTVVAHEDGEKEAYALTPPSRLFLKDDCINLSTFVVAMLDPTLVNPWYSLGDWFRGIEPTPFAKAHGMGVWDYCNQNPEYGNTFNVAMASDSRFLRLVVKDYKPIFECLCSLVDVGGGTGTLARIISEAFPHIKCTVYDLPHVVTNLLETSNLKVLGGDMFQSIPLANAILFKWIMHDWNDEECVKILKRCKEAITSKGYKEGNKVIIVDAVIDAEKDDEDITKAKLLFDTMMMVLAPGKERTEKEWEKLFLEAGFRSYKIVASHGMKSLIELYPYWSDNMINIYLY